MEKIEVNLMGGQPNGNVLTILEGEALPQREPEKLVLSGDIRSVSTFVKGRNGDVNDHQRPIPGSAVIIVDKTARTILLRTHPNSPFGTEVTGKLEVSDELAKFRINEAKLLTQKEVVDILKFNKVFFKDTERQETVLKAYQAFTYSANTTGKNESDLRGNKQNNYTKIVETNLPNDFVLRIPIFKGEEYKEFRVEICYDVTDGSVRFWFESVELHELMEIEKQMIFSRELNECEGLVIIYK